MLDRRLFLGNTVAALSLTLMKWVQDKWPLRFQPTCTFQVRIYAEGDEAGLLAGRPWEDKSAFRDLNEKYQRDGRLLSVKESLSRSSSQWTYVFNNFKSYRQWELDAVQAKAYREQDLPVGVRYEFLLNGKPTA